MALARIQVRRGTSAQWASSNPILAAGEPGFDTTLKQLRIGDGSTPWSGLPAATPDAATIADLLAVADAVEGAVAPTDAAMASAIANPATATSGALSAAIAAVVNGGVGPLKVFPLSTFLDAGQSLPNDGVANASPLLQEALDAAYAWRLANGASFRAGGIPAQISVPGGAYRINTALTPRSGVGIKGAGGDVTGFYPYGTQCFMLGTLYSSEPVGGWEPTMLDDMLFEDFFVDCINQTKTSYDGAIKAFFMQNLRRARFHRVKAYNSWASMFGVDFLVDCEFTDCYGKGAGRGGPADVIGTGSIFAYGTGRFENESIRFTNCIAEDAAAGGWFLERIDFRDALLQTPGYTLSNCRSVRNAVGLIDAGTGGIKAVGCDFSHNKNVGWYAGSGGVAAVGGRDGLISACTFYDNGDGTTTGTVNGGHGIAFARNYTIGGYSVEGTQFLGNAGAGIALLNDTIPTKGGLKLRGCTFRRNQYGLLLQPIRTRLTGLEVDGCLFDDNTVAGLWFDDSLQAPIVRGNTFMGDDQPVGVRWPSGKPVIAPIVRDNVFVDQADAQVNDGALDPARISGNVETRTPDFAARTLAGAEPVYIIDGSSSVLRNANVVWDAAQPSTTYLVMDAPAANRRLQLRTAAGTPQLDIGRNSGDTAWVALARNSSGANQFAQVDQQAGAAVMCAVRTQNAIDLHVNGVGSATQAVTGWSNTPAVTNVQRQAGIVYAVTFNGAHSESVRAAIMQALASYFAITPVTVGDDGLSGTAVDGVAASDSFTRSGELVGSNPTVGRRAWAGSTGKISTNGTRAVSQGVDQTQIILDVAARGAYDVSCTMRLSTQEASAKAIRLYPKYVDGNNCVYLIISGSTSASVSLRVVAGGTQRVLSSFTTTTIPANTPAADYAVQISIDGLNVSATVNGVTRTATLTETEAAAIVDAAKIAIAGDSTNHQWDNLVVDVNGIYV